MDINEIKESVKKNVKITNSPIKEKGGQSCGIIFPKQELYSEELDLKIIVGYHKSTIKNRELLIKLFNIALDDLVF